MAYEDCSDDSANLMIAVDRLSTQDQARIIRLITLLGIAPAWLRDRTQRMLRDLIARQPQMQIDCLAHIDAIITRAERELEQNLLLEVPSDCAGIGVDGPEVSRARQFAG
jgi:hypothetical protein